MSTVVATPDVAREMLTDDLTAASILFNADANAAGEMLRALTFPEHNTDGDVETYAVGCASTFVVREDAVKLEGEERLELIHLDTDEPWDFSDDEERREFESEVSWIDGIATTVRFNEGGVQIDCFWYWDGDGILWYRIRHGASERVLVNGDCKKSDRWVEKRRDVVSGEVLSVVPLPVVEAMAEAVEKLIAVAGDAQPAPALQQARQEADEALEAYRAASRKGAR